MTPAIVAMVVTSIFTLLTPVLLPLGYVCIILNEQRWMKKIKSLFGKWSRPIVKSYFNTMFSKASSEDAGATEGHEELCINGKKVDLLTLILLSLYVQVAAIAIVTIIWLPLFIHITYVCDHNLDCFTIVVDDDGSEISATPVNDCSSVNDTSIICYRHYINSNALV